MPDYFEIIMSSDKYTDEFKKMLKTLNLYVGENVIIAKYRYNRKDWQEDLTNLYNRIIAKIKIQTSDENAIFIENLEKYKNNIYVNTIFSNGGYVQYIDLAETIMSSV